MTYFEKLKAKVINVEELKPILEKLQQNRQKIVFTNGCFDIVHRGHVEYHSKASDTGDFMIVGLNSDASVKRLKGNNRPLQDQTSRALVLAAMEFVNAVVMFDEDTPYNLIKSLQPDILIKGADYHPESIVGYDVVTARGGIVKTIELTEGYSTSNVIRKING
jgi:rfaE bifunctional protein nucleotidyltransferase chain/domain